MATSAPLSIVDSLYESRRTLLHEAFTPFSASSAPPHHLRSLGQTTLSVGPHYFPSTSVFLAEWTSPSSSSSSSSAAAPAAAPSGEITPALIAKLNAASQSDPALAEIMRKAATNQASPDELSHLARYIETLREGSEDGGGKAAGGGASDPPSIVFEFNEKPGARFVLPAHVLYTPLAPGMVPYPFPPSPPSSPSTSDASAPKQGQADVLLSLFLFPSTVPSLVARHKSRLRTFSTSAAVAADLAAAAGVVPPSAPVPVDVVVHKADQALREGLWRAARNSRPKEQEVEGWWKQMIAAVPVRTHVLHVPPPVVAADSSAALAGPDASLSTGVSRTASEVPVASGSGLGSKRGGTPVVAPPAKKSKPAPKKKAAARPSASRARSKASASASLAGTPAAASPSAPLAAASPSLAGSPGPCSLAGSPAPESVVGAGGKKKPAATAKKGGKGAQG
ncbi:hypothetical protein JCM11251_000713 [Rhodosporidiobolus azoricus]